MKTVKFKRGEQTEYGILVDKNTIQLLKKVDKGFEATTELVEVESYEPEKVSYTTSLESEYTLYKKGLSEKPRGEVKGLIQKGKDDRYKVTLTEEVKDRDGETVMIDGITVPENGVVFIDAHEMNGSVIKTRLGSVIDLRAEGKQIKGDIILVDTEAGREIKKILDDPRHPFPVSMGFGVEEYDINTKQILKWELYELSAVNVPANVRAKVDRKHFEDTEKALSHYKTIKPAFKEFSKSFLSDSFCKTIGYEKSGDLLVDIVSIYEIVLDKLTVDTVETPPTTTSSKSTKKELTEDQLNKLIGSLVSEIIISKVSGK